MKNQNLQTTHVLDLNKVIAKDLNGTIWEVQDIHKVIGNIIFMNSVPIELDTIARTLHSGKTADVTMEDLMIISEIIERNPYYKPFVTKAIINYINSLINNQKNG